MKAILALAGAIALVSGNVVYAAGHADAATATQERKESTAKGARHHSMNKTKGHMNKMEGKMQGKMGGAMTGKMKGK